MTTAPTHLFVGEENQLQQETIKRLQRVFCKKEANTEQSSGACFCHACRNIKNRQHHAVIWIEPEKTYLLSDIAVIFEKIRFVLDEGQQVFFILQKAHRLTPVCANKLLKTLEEPPHGYTFFLLTNNEQSIIPTIRSRCYIHHLKPSNLPLFFHPLINFFIDPEKRADPFLFEQVLKKEKPTEQETIDLVHSLINALKQQIKNYHKSCVLKSDIEKLNREPKYKKVCATLQLFEQQLQKPPPAGGAAMFWKKLFLLSV